MDKYTTYIEPEYIPMRCQIIAYDTKNLTSVFILEKNKQTISLYKKVFGWPIVILLLPPVGGL